MSGIKRYAISEFDGDLITIDSGDLIDWGDHIANHAFDEAVERAAFFEWVESSKCNRPNSPWDIWEACAKFRAKRFGGAE